jgi:hypothetical protein
MPRSKNTFNRRTPSLPHTLSVRKLVDFFEKNNENPEEGLAEIPEENSDQNQQRAGLPAQGFVRKQTALSQGQSRATSFQSQALHLDRIRLQQIFGYLDHLIDDVVEEAAIINAIATIRAKPWHEINTVHLDAIFKGTGISDKSAKASSAEAGLVLSGHTLPMSYFADIDARRAIDFKEYPPGVYPLPAAMTDANGNPQFVTYPLQTLATIEARIASKYYTNVNTYVENGIFVREFSDALGGRFRVEYDPGKLTEIEFTTGSPLTVRQRKTLLETKSRRKPTQTKDRSFEVVNKRVPYKEVYVKVDGKSVLDESKSEYVEYDSYVGLEKLIAKNANSAVTLRRIDNPTPYVICSPMGKCMKGDVDLQDSLLPSDLPLMAYKFINTKHPPAPSDICAKDINELIVIMNEFYSQLEQMKHHNPSGTAKYKKIQALILLAYINLQKIQKERQKLQQDGDSIANADAIILKEIGVVDLFNAVLIFARQDGRLHGADASTPLYPENIAATHIPSVSNPNKFIVTHGEYEYLKELLRNPEFDVDAYGVFHLKSFNPCQLVTDQTWRKDIQDTVCSEDGKVHQYNNKKDEDYSVKMQRLLLERQLLRCKHFSPERYDDYIKVLRRNIELIVLNVKVKDNEQRQKLIADLMAGHFQVEAIIRTVAQCEDIPGRLRQIKEITDHSDDSLIREKLRGISLEHYTGAKRRFSSSSTSPQPRSQYSDPLDTPAPPPSKRVNKP